MTDFGISAVTARRQSASENVQFATGMPFARTLTLCFFPGPGTKPRTSASRKKSEFAAVLGTGKERKLACGPMVQTPHASRTPHPVSGLKRPLEGNGPSASTLGHRNRVSPVPVPFGLEIQTSPDLNSLLFADDSTCARSWNLPTKLSGSLKGASSVLVCTTFRPASVAPQAASLPVRSSTVREVTG